MTFWFLRVPRRSLQLAHNLAYRHSQQLQESEERRRNLVQYRRAAMKVGSNILLRPGMLVLHVDPALHNASEAHVRLAADPAQAPRNSSPPTPLVERLLFHTARAE
jgi:hypothetical protein